MSVTAAPRGESYDAIVVGGGFFGTALALELRERVRSVLLLERQVELLTQASYVNQARVHHGYHYPRSVLTAYRSSVNFARFTRDYAEAIDRSFTQVYAVARVGSKVSTSQFHQFCQRIGAPIEPAPPEVMALMNPDLIDSAFVVEEFAFNAAILRQRAMRELDRREVEWAVSTAATRVEPTGTTPHGLKVVLEGQRELRAKAVFLCGYASINRFLEASSLPRIPFKHELVEMVLIEAPPALKGYGVTVMDGPFFGTMPFPARGVHSLYHVRYSPHFHWNEGGPDDPPVPPEQLAEVDRQVAQKSRPSKYPHIIRDAQRYLPALEGARQVDSLWTVRTVLPRAERDDSRPILFSKHHGLKNFFCVAGGKIDNVYDLLEELKSVELS